MPFQDWFGVQSQLSQVSLNARATNWVSALTGLTIWGSNLLPFTMSTLMVRLNADFIYFLLHSIYIIDHYHIFTRFYLNFFIVSLMNWLQLAHRRNRSTPMKLKWKPGNKDWGTTSGHDRVNCNRRGSVGAFCMK